MKFERTRADSPYLIPTLGRVTSLQQRLLVDRHGKDDGQGFLVSAFSEPEFQELMRTHDGEILSAFVDSTFVGYVLTTAFTEFSSLYSGPNPIGLLTLLPGKSLATPRFLYQIAIAPEWMGKGVGKKLLDEVKTTSGGELLADVLVEPLHNKTSIEFFRRNGFQTVGELTLHNYRDFGALKSQVMLWGRERVRKGT